MDFLSELKTGYNYLYSTDYYSNDYNHIIYIKKGKPDNRNKDKIYLKIYTIINGLEVLQGFIYFYVDKNSKTSDFIGLKVEPQFRNQNISSLLISLWIDICLNNGYDFLGTNKKQRKPFILYLLKTYGFDVYDTIMYYTRKDVIGICRSEDLTDTTKMLLFKSKYHEKTFICTNNFKKDNYFIVHDLKGLTLLDHVIMPLQNFKSTHVEYELQDKDKCLDKTTRVLHRHKK